jgi:hypothetical protein
MVREVLGDPKQEKPYLCGRVVEAEGWPAASSKRKIRMGHSKRFSGAWLRGHKAHHNKKAGAK